MRRSLPILFALPIVVAAGYVHGRWTDRWEPSRAVEAAVARLSRVPNQVGDWKGTDMELGRKTAEKAGIDGYVMRRYVNSSTGATLSVLLVCGRPGPIAAHTPEVCYGGAGYEAVSDPARLTVRSGEKSTPAEFFAGTFAKPVVHDPERLRVLWSWNGAGAWETSDNPRLSFARHRCLYKLYIVREASKTDPGAGEDPAIAFAERLLPELKIAQF